MNERVPDAREVSHMLVRYAEMIQSHAAAAELMEKMTGKPQGLTIMRDEIDRATYIAGYLWTKKGTL